MTIKPLGDEGEGVPHQPTRSPEKNFWVLDWLRFLLAIYLVLFHTLRTSYGEVRDTWLDNVLGLGNFATSIFFVLSGFLLTYAYVVRRGGRIPDTRKFFIARFSTLYPLHIVGLVLALIPAAITIYTRGGVSVAVIPDGPPARMLSHTEFVSSLITNIVMLNAWNPYYLVINIPSWSLSALAFFYLTFPVLAPAIYRARRPAFLLVMLGLLFTLPGLIADVLQRTDILTQGLLHRNPVIRLPLFVAGIALCVLFSRGGLPTSSSFRAVPWAIIVATVAVGVYFQHMDMHLHLIKNGLYYPASLAVIWLCASAGPTLSTSLRYWGARLGSASLPLFFLHAPVFMLFNKLEKFLTALLATSPPSLKSAAAAARDIAPSVVVYPLYLALLIVLCVLIQERFVLPLQAWIRNHFANRELDGGTAKKSLSAN